MKLGFIDALLLGGWALLGVSLAGAPLFTLYEYPTYLIQIMYELQILSVGLIIAGGILVFVNHFRTPPRAKITP